MIEGCHTQEEWQDLIIGLPAQAQVQFLLASQPKEIKADISSTFQLIIKGLEQRVLESKATEVKALEEYIEEDP